MNALVAVYIYSLVPEFLMRFLAWLLVHTFYRVRQEGLENIPDEGPCIVVCNHVSYVDAVVIAACVQAADSLRHGSPDIPRAAAGVHLQGDAGDSDRPGARGSGAEEPRIRRGRRRRSPPARSSASSPKATSRTPVTSIRSGPASSRSSRRRRCRSCRWRCADCGAASSRVRTREVRCAGSAACFRGLRSSHRRRYPPPTRRPMRCSHA